MADYKLMLLGIGIAAIVVAASCALFLGPGTDALKSEEQLTEGDYYSFSYSLESRQITVTAFDGEYVTFENLGGTFAMTVDEVMETYFAADTAGYTKTGNETIDTIIGRKECEVYVKDGSEDKIWVYNGILMQSSVEYRTGVVVVRTLTDMLDDDGTMKTPAVGQYIGYGEYFERTYKLASKYTDDIWVVDINGVEDLMTGELFMEQISGDPGHADRTAVTAVDTPFGKRVCDVYTGASPSGTGYTYYISNGIVYERIMESDFSTSVRTLTATNMFV